MDNIRDEIAFITTRNGIFSTLEDLVKQRGFLRVESDYFEDFIRYTNQNKRQDPRQLVKVQDLKGNLFLLQPDITTNIIKQVIPRIDDEFAVDFYYLDNIFSYGEDGSIQTTRQFGVEVIGRPKIDADIDIIQLIDQIFWTNQLDITIELGNQKWIETVISHLGLSENKSAMLKRLIIAKNRLEITELLDDNSSPYKELLLNVLRTENDIDGYIAFITDNKLDPVLIDEALKLRTIQQQINDQVIIIDLSLINPFDYYNGPIFKGYLTGINKDVVRGGRYDYLTEEFGNQTPALGFSIDVDILVQEVVRRG